MLFGMWGRRLDGWMLMCCWRMSVSCRKFLLVLVLVVVRMVCRMCCVILFLIFFMCCFLCFGVRLRRIR